MYKKKWDSCYIRQVSKKLTAGTAIGSGIAIAGCYWHPIYHSENHRVAACVELESVQGTGILVGNNQSLEVVHTSH